MHLSLFTPDGALFFLRWIHVFAGIIWIGMLYYFNFVQGEFFKEIDAGVKGICTQKLVPRALFWFRWGAMITFISGLLIITGTMHTGVPLKSAWGVLILIGSGIGTLMWFNVWFVIWPAKKVIIASAVQVASGGQALPGVADKASRAWVASRSNVMFSLPLLFFMGAARHLILSRNFDTVSYWSVVGSIGGIFLLFELNALKGKLGPLQTVKGVIHCGVVLTLAIYLLVEATTL